MFSDEERLFHMRNMCLNCNSVACPFSIWDTEILLVKINSNVKLKDALKELRKQVKIICAARKLTYSPHRIYAAGRRQIPLSIDTEYNLRKALEIAKLNNPLPLFLKDTMGRNTKIAEIFTNCLPGCGHDKCTSNLLTLSAGFESIRSDQNSKNDKHDIFKNRHKPLRISTNLSDDELPENFATYKEVNKLHNDVHKKQKQELDDTKVHPSSNQLHDSDTVSVSWLKEYMGAMKDDMVNKITHEVTKKVTKKIIKHLDFHLQYIHHKQKHPQNTSFLEQDTRGSSEPIEKNQEQKSSQDEERSSDASIERMEAPQNDTKDAQVTKHERSTVNSKKIVKDISEYALQNLLYKNSINPIVFTLSKNHEKSGDLIKKNGKETTLQIEEQLSEKVSAESQDATTVEHPYLSEMKMIKDKIREFVLEEEKILKKHRQRDAQIATDNLEEEAQSQEKTDENLFTTNLQLRSADWKPAQIGHHMSCSVTGHQMLDETLQSKDMWSGRRNDVDVAVDKTSFSSCNREEDDDDAFEIIQMPTLETENTSFTSLKEPVAEQQLNDSNRDSPSFELLTEPSSPCSIYITEDYFAASEGKSDEDNPQVNNNNPTNYDGHHPKFDKSVKSTNTDVKKQSDGAYSFVTETLPVQDFNLFCKSRKEIMQLRAKQRSNEGKDSWDNGSGDENSFTANPQLRLMIRPADWLPELVSEDTFGLYDDVRNSHTSYLTVQTPCDCQSQCANSSDLTQSFHSHTTSINDITDVSHRLYTDNLHSSQMLSTDGQDNAAVIPESGLNPQVCSDRMKNTKTNERHDADNYPKCLEFNAQDAYTNAQHQFHHANSGFVDRSSSSDGSAKEFAAEQSLGPADSVHILPETLVIAAAQVGSFAYDTAREVFDKIRAHAKEDSTKRRNGTKSDHKKPFGNLPFI